MRPITAALALLTAFLLVGCTQAAAQTPGGGTGGGGASSAPATGDDTASGDLVAPNGFPVGAENVGEAGNAFQPPTPSSTLESYGMDVFDADAGQTLLVRGFDLHWTSVAQDGWDGWVNDEIAPWFLVSIDDVTAATTGIYGTNQQLVRGRIRLIADAAQLPADFDLTRLFLFPVSTANPKAEQFRLLDSGEVPGCTYTTNPWAAGASDDTVSFCFALSAPSSKSAIVLTKLYLPAEVAGGPGDNADGSVNTASRPSLWAVTPPASAFVTDTPTVAPSNGYGGF